MKAARSILRRQLGRAFRDACVQYFALSAFKHDQPAFRRAHQVCARMLDLLSYAAAENGTVHDTLIYLEAARDE